MALVAGLTFSFKMSIPASVNDPDFLSACHCMRAASIATSTSTVIIWLSPYRISDRVMHG